MTFEFSTKSTSYYKLVRVTVNITFCHFYLQCLHLETKITHSTKLRNCLLIVDLFKANLSYVGILQSLCKLDLILSLKFRFSEKATKFKEPFHLNLKLLMFFFSLDWPVIKNQILSTKCQPMFFVVNVKKRPSQKT